MSHLAGRFLECAVIKDDNDLRASAIYGLGVMAANYPSFVNYVPQALKISFEQFQQPYLEGEVDAIHDNCASTIGKLCRYHGKVFNVADVYNKWITTCFPMRGDAQEARWCIDEFMRLISAKDTNFLGPNMGRLRQILALFVDWKDTNLSSEEADVKIETLCKQIKANPSTAGLLAGFTPIQISKLLGENQS